MITSLHWIDAFPLTALSSGYISKRTELLDDSFKPSDYGIKKKSNTELNDYLDTLVTKWSKDGSLQNSMTDTSSNHQAIPQIKEDTHDRFIILDILIAGFWTIFQWFPLTLALAIGSFILRHGLRNHL